MKNITEIRHAIDQIDQGLEPVFAVQHFYLRLVFELLIVSFFSKYSQYSSKNCLD